MGCVKKVVPWIVDPIGSAIQKTHGVRLHPGRDGEQDPESAEAEPAEAAAARRRRRRCRRCRPVDHDGGRRRRAPPPPAPWRPRADAGAEGAGHEGTGASAAADRTRGLVVQQEEARRPEPAVVTETHVLPMPPPPSLDHGLVFTTGWTDGHGVCRPAASSRTTIRSMKATPRSWTRRRTERLSWSRPPMAGRSRSSRAGRSSAPTWPCAATSAGLRQWHGKYRVGLALWAQWLSLCRAEKLHTIVIGIDRRDPSEYRHRVERFARLAGFTQYDASGGTTWHRLEVA